VGIPIPDKSVFQMGVFSWNRAFEYWMTWKLELRTELKYNFKRHFAILLPIRELNVKKIMAAEQKSNDSTIQFLVVNLSWNWMVLVFGCPDLGSPLKFLIVKCICDWYLRQSRKNICCLHFPIFSKLLQWPTEYRTVVGLWIVSYASPRHSNIGPFKNRTFVSGLLA
jgi:hypothetical protein